MQAFKSLRETVSSNMNYHKYRLELRNVHITPCIPCLGMCVRVRACACVCVCVCVCVHACTLQLVTYFNVLT